MVRADEIRPEDHVPGMRQRIIVEIEAIRNASSVGGACPLKVQ
jgi:hypothetical protein